MLGSRDDQLSNETHISPLSRSEAILIVLTTYFHEISPIKLQEQQSMT